MSAEPMRKCFACYEWTQLPHAEFFCSRCYGQPWRIRNAIEAREATLRGALKNCLAMSPLNPFERGDMITAALEATIPTTDFCQPAHE